MIRFVFLLSSGDSEYVYMYVDCVWLCDFVNHNKKKFKYNNKTLTQNEHMIYVFIWNKLFSIFRNVPRESL